ncbi:MAG: DNA repair protein RadC [Emergencia sp.]
MRIKSLPENERPVEKAWDTGIESLSNAELLALIIHTGTQNRSALRLAEAVLGAFPEGMSGLASCCLEDLTVIEGIGRTKACTLLAAVEIGKRIASRPAAERVIIERSDDIARLFMEKLRYAKKEHFKCVLVNSKGGILSVDDISTGELTSTVVHPREVFHMAVRKSAAAVILVHNHPSGDPSPSGEDIATTRRLTESGRLLGITVVDHIIIGDGTYCSLREMGLID